MYILIILSNCNYLCKIYYTFKKVFKCTIVIKKEKIAIGNNNKIKRHGNINILNIWNNPN